MALSKITNASVADTAVHGRRNLIINGAMQVAQRSTSTTVGDSASFKTVDRWAIGINGTTAGRATMSQSTDAPAGFGYSVKFDVTTADTSIASGESFGFYQRIEGQNVQHMAKGTSSAKKCVFSFYAKGTPKKYITEFRDDNSRFFSATFDVTTSWQRFEIEIPADTTGTIDNDNTSGFLALFWLHAGSDFTSGTLGTSWAASTNANRMVGCESIFSSTDNELFVTGCQLEVSDTATPFEHRSYGEELALCQRYYEEGLVQGTAAHSNTGYMVLRYVPRVEKRGEPSVTMGNVYIENAAAGTQTNTATWTSNGSGSGYAHVVCSHYPAVSYYGGEAKGFAKITMDAEL